MKKFLVLIISLGILISNTPAGASTKINLSDPYVGVRMIENQELLTDTPNLMSYRGLENQKNFFLCGSLGDETCTSGISVKATSFLPPCSEAINQNCILDLYAVDSSGKKYQGIFQRYVADGSRNEFPGNEKFNLPQGRGQGSVWRMPGLTNGAGNEDYFVGARMDAWAQVAAGKIVENFYPTRMITGISPISTKLGDFNNTYAVDSNNPSNDGSPNGGVGSGNSSHDQSWKDCVVTELGKCYMAANFPEGFRFGIKLKLGATLRGWFHGRIYQPTVNVENGSGGSEVLTIEALPVIVPTIEEKVPTASLSQDLKNYLQNNSVSNGFGYVMPEASEPNSIEHTKLWIPMIKDRATKSLTYWSVRTLGNITDPVVSNCTKRDGALSGVVTTNSLAYNGGPPEFDVITQSLNYRVLSTHFNADDSVAKGTYDLIMSSSVARCIYGFTQAPISATLTILSEDGSPQVATQTISEKDGWLTLSAAGFTYSSPTIKVKLSQEAVAAPSPSAKPTPTSKAKVTITCLKGKSKKRISAVKPSCPAGYRRVA